MESPEPAARAEVRLIFRIALGQRNGYLPGVTPSMSGRTFPDPSRMNRLIRLVLELMPPGLRDLTRAAGLDVEATCRLQPLAELLALARKNRGWSSLLAAKATGVRRRTIDAAEAANPARIDAPELIAYSARLGTLHLLAEWVSANPRLARALGFPEESAVLGQGRLVLAEDGRVANLLPRALPAVAPRRFEAPADFSQHLDPDRAEERLAAFFAQTKNGSLPGLSPGAATLASPDPEPPEVAPELPPKSAAPALYQFKVSLRHVRPLIWRRIIVPNDLTFARLHDLLQAVMGWTNSHLHAFRWRDIEIGVPDPEWQHPLHDERHVRLADLALDPRSRLLYAYDFGDGWEHDLLLEKILPTQDGFVPVCLKGARACPPEDCGGPHSYPDFLAVSANPDHPDHAEMNDWIGGVWNAEAFDLEGVNRRLRRLAARWKQRNRGGKKA